ncbi:MULTISPECIES: proton-conducting transporter membrane subunit [Thermus]|uniref:Hydrogenase-4, subunit B n=1 Tax=Thermus scotoductus (strain ATCC 700910 / SA-01) TaxID=743525 RepID=E8PJT7_THESS|nr:MULTISPECIES: proton-conducting transporter membrane subunit [Thermus]ADW22042.1 hydrogenase-4, subunit B [Thermus scotoductus SA-01]
MSPLWTFLPLALALLSAGTPWRFRGLSLFLGMAGLAWGVLGGMGWASGLGAPYLYLFLLGALTLGLAPYLPAYLAHHPREAHLYGLLLPLFLASMAGVALASPGLGFLFLWEGMALLGYFLIALEGPNALAGARAFFLASRLSGAGLYLAFLGHGHVGADWVWAGLLLGFGVKAALFPFHAWLPQAHPVAISPVSALLSGAMTKLGLLGLYQSQYWFGPPPPWVGWVLLLLGLLGAVYALVRGLGEEDLKGALAYSSVENLGLMLAALGAYFLKPMPLLLGAFFLHQVAHALFKGLLFLGAGALEERRISHLGGLFRKAPGLGALALWGMGVGAGLPPGPVFLAEWQLYQGFLQGPFLVPLAAGALALVGALALYFYVRLFGLAFLGLPRGEAALHWTQGMRLSLGVLAGLLLLLALVPGLVLDPLGVRTYPNWLLLILLGVLAGVFYRGLLRMPMRAYGTWDCGFQPLTPRMQPNGLGFAEPALRLFPFLRLQVGEHPRLEEPLAEVYPGVGRIYARLAAWVQTLQSGSLHLYLLLQLLTLVVVLGVVLL